VSLFLGGTKIDGVYLGRPASTFTPVEVKIITAGAWSYTIPAGATKIDVVCFGGGGGGNGSGAFGDADGGSEGGSAFKTYTVGSTGSDFAAGGTITGSNGLGGKYGTGPFDNPGPGTATTVIGGLSAPGGKQADDGAGNPQGGTPAPVTLNGRVYVGGQGGNRVGTGPIGDSPATDGEVGGGGGGGGGASATNNRGGKGGGGATYLYFYSGTSGHGMADAVYLGTEKVWPIYVATLSPWYSPGGATGSNGKVYIDVPWPAGAEFCDVVMISGGAGGTGTGVGGNPQLGGGEGKWAGATIPRVLVDRVYSAVRIYANSESGTDGVGGGNFNTQAADGSHIVINCLNERGTWAWAAQSTGASDKTSNTGNRNGGNVATEFVFNGRTYTLASYGTNAGRGGASSNKNGGDGTRPGGGGQSADNGGLTGYSGGKGAHGAAQLYWY